MIRQWFASHLMHLVQAPDLPQDVATARFEVENARVGYAKAVDLYVMEGNRIWARFAGMLTANGLMITAEALFLTRPEAVQALPFLPPAFPCAGVMLCMLWLQLTARGYAWMYHFIAHARLLEGKISDPVKTVVSGHEFDIGGMDGWLSRALTMRANSFLTILVVMSLHLVLLTQYIAFAISSPPVSSAALPTPTVLSSPAPTP